MVCHGGGVVGVCVGYYTNSTLQELSQRVVALEADTAALDLAQPFATTNRDTSEDLTMTDETVLSVTVTAPVTGQVTVISTTAAVEATFDIRVRCSITTGVTLDGDYMQEWESAGPSGEAAQLAGTRTFDVAAGATVTYRLVCDTSTGSGPSNLTDSVLTAIFTPAP